MKKTLITTAAIAALTLTACPQAKAIDKGYQAEIYKEAYKTLSKYKEVTLTQSGPTKVSKLKTRPFKKENHGLMKPRSLEGWLVPVQLDERQLWLSFKVEVLDFPRVLRAIKEFHSIYDIKLVTSSEQNAKTVKLKDTPEPALTNSQRTLISRAIVKQAERLNKKFTAEEYKEQFEIAKKNLSGSHKVGMTLEEETTVVIRDKK